jgi:hypothetical protein
VGCSGSKVIENQAHAFAAAFLTPADQVADDLPRRLDWPALHRAKRRWGVSLKALVYRAHSLKLLNESAYRRANIQLAEWGNPEPGPLGPPESPSLLGAAIGMLSETGVTIHDLAEHASLPVERVQDIVDAATERRPHIDWRSTREYRDTEQRLAVQ